VSRGHLPKEARIQTEEGTVLQYFSSGWITGVFAGGFGKNRGAERGFSMVKLWWIAGESW
jgi:hypothetical protein